ncbi:MAG: trigger factor [Rhodospirillales bacterium]|nr:trigger factor [Rhodospirillales bacterium]
MQVTETKTDGLKREFRVVVAASDIQGKMDVRLQEIGRKINLPGFRPGKVPIPVLKKRYGSAVMGEVLEQAVSDSSSQAMAERGLKPAVAPKVDITAFAEGGDLEYTMAVELMPEIKPMDFAKLKLERLVAEVNDDEVNKALERIAAQHRKSEKLTEDRPSAKGDILVIDFAGSIDGKEFPGGAGKDHSLELGSNAFIAGFEDQLIGIKAGGKTEVKVTFPAEYANPELAGKPASFTVEVKEIQQRLPVKLDDELAKSLGLDDLDSLKKAIRDQMGKDYARIARARLKRQLLDRLAENHDFVVPAGMVELEFEAIWKNVEAERKQGVDDPTIAGKSDDDLKAELRGIAERRVRLGLLLSEVGRLNNIQVAQEEVNRALIEEARRYPGQERKVVEHFRNSPEALAQLRAPLFEDKVIDFIVEMAKVADKPVGVDELMKEPEEGAAA